MAIGMDARNADGIAFGKMGNMYVTAADMYIGVVAAGQSLAS